jgi:2-aminoadipate transaminase
VTQALVAEYCARGFIEPHISRVIATYAGKCLAMGASLAAHIPAGRVTWHTPAGGFFFWLHFPGEDSEALFHRAVAENVAFVPGHSFFPDAEEQVGEVHLGREYARLCFSYADPGLVDEGCRRLGRALAG